MVKKKSQENKKHVAAHKGKPHVVIAFTSLIASPGRNKHAPANKMNYIHYALPEKIKCTS